MGHGDSKTTHLFFADDSLLFMKAYGNSVETFKSIMEDYEGASRQVSNMQKSLIFFEEGVVE